MDDLGVPSFFGNLQIRSWVAAFPFVRCQDQNFGPDFEEFGDMQFWIHTNSPSTTKWVSSHYFSEVIPRHLRVTCRSLMVMVEKLRDLWIWCSQQMHHPPANTVIFFHPSICILIFTLNIAVIQPYFGDSLDNLSFLLMFESLTFFTGTWPAGSSRTEWAHGKTIALHGEFPLLQLNSP